MAEIRKPAHWSWIAAFLAAVLVAASVACLAGRPTKKTALDLHQLGRSAAHSVSYPA